MVTTMPNPINIRIALLRILPAGSNACRRHPRSVSATASPPDDRARENDAFGKKTDKNMGSLQSEKREGGIDSIAPGWVRVGTVCAMRGAYTHATLSPDTICYAFAFVKPAAAL